MVAAGGVSICLYAGHKRATSWAVTSTGGGAEFDPAPDWRSIKAVVAELLNAVPERFRHCVNGKPSYVHLVSWGLPHVRFSRSSERWRRSCRASLALPYDRTPFRIRILRRCSPPPREQCRYRRRPVTGQSKTMAQSPGPIHGPKNRLLLRRWARTVAPISHQPQSLQTRMPIPADNNVVVHCDAKRPRDVDDRFCHQDIGLRRRRVAGGVVVHQDQRGA
jgi:hypothetical protein